MIRASRLPQVIAGLALAVAAFLFFAPGPADVSPQLMRAGALAVFAIGFWATGALPEHITALAFFFLAMLFGVTPPWVAFSGFHSTAFWLIFGGLVIGVAIRRSGLGERLARALAARMGATYPAIIAGCVVMASVLALLMPSSMGRVVILTPIVLALADRFGFAPGSRGRAGMALAACLGTVMTGSGILPANVPNMVLIGASETLYAFVPEYGTYFLLHFPVTAALKGVALVACICLLLPDRPQPAEHNVKPGTGETGDAKTVAGDGSAGRLAIILGFALAFWATDFIHHVSPAWIALGAALLCFLPRVGMVPASAFNDEINYGSLFYVAAILGLGAMIADSGLGNLLTGVLVEAIGFAPDQPFRSFVAMSLLTTVVGTVTTIPGLPAIMTPLGAGIADATGLALETVLMTQVIGYSTILLPYQAPPIIVGIQLGGVTMRDAGRVMLALAAATVVVLLPLNYLWWSLLGMFA